MPLRLVASVICAALAGACSGSQRGPRGAPPPPAATAAGSAVVDPALGCALRPGDDPKACAARPGGCALGPPLECSGVEIPPDMREPPDPHPPCQCICEADRRACSEVP
jgi:hypothetical protein